MVLIMVIFRDFFLETHWYILTVKCLDLMKAFGNFSLLRIH